ncbi:hypothetical protein EJB05_32653, partial [Eragrostis curvula]
MAPRRRALPLPLPASWNRGRDMHGAPWPRIALSLQSKQRAREILVSTFTEASLPTADPGMHTSVRTKDSAKQVISHSMVSDSTYPGRMWKDVGLEFSWEFILRSTIKAAMTLPWDSGNAVCNPANHDKILGRLPYTNYIYPQRFEEDPSSKT